MPLKPIVLLCCDPQAFLPSVPSAAWESMLLAPPCVSLQLEPKGPPQLVAKCGRLMTQKDRFEHRLLFAWTFFFLDVDAFWVSCKLVNC